MDVAVNLGMLFAAAPPRERFAAAADAGAGLVEFPWPALPREEVAGLVRAAGVRVALLNMDAGDIAAGHRGFGNDPGRVHRWREQLGRAVDLARTLGCPAVNVLAGRLLPGLDEEEQRRCLVGNLRWAAGLAARAGRVIVVEPINDRDIPGYLLPRVADVLGALELVGHEAVRLQLDAYHVAAMGDDVGQAVALARGRIGHVQVADFPGRHEPGTGRLDLDALLDALEAAGYGGAIGLEYVPTSPPDDSLRAVLARYPRLGAGRRTANGRPPQHASGQSSTAQSPTAQSPTARPAPGRRPRPKDGRRGGGRPSGRRGQETEGRMP